MFDWYLKKKKREKKMVAKIICLRKEKVKSLGPKEINK